MRLPGIGLVMALALLAAACPDSLSPLAGGDAGILEGGTLGDRDGDKLCDDTEEMLGTDPADADTDDDGFPDFVEAVNGYDATGPGEPDRDFVITMRENPLSSVQVPVSVIVDGEGEDFAGAFEALQPGDGAITAADFYESSVAQLANPESNVVVVEESLERFRGVVGRTQLNFEVRLAFADNLVRRCVRGLPFRYSVKRSDGRLVASLRYLLVVLPEGETVASGAWCVPPYSCI